MKLLRNPAVLIAIVCVAPALLGWLVYAFHWDTGAAGNYGELVTPRSLSGPPIDAVKGKWALLVFDAASCDAGCEKKLYIVRQIRRAQGRDMERIERIWLLTDAGTPRAALLEAIDGTRIVKPPPGFSQGFPGAPASDIYLVDPLGNLMMRYPADPEPKKMIKDLQRLLRYSRVG